MAPSPSPRLPSPRLYDIPASESVGFQPRPPTMRQKSAADELVGHIKDEIDKRYLTLTEAFRDLDEDKSGKLSQDELIHVIEKWDGTLAEQQTMRSIMEASDKDGDGLIEYAEFATALVHSARQESDIFRTDEARSAAIGANFSTRTGGSQMIMNDGLDANLAGGGRRVAEQLSQAEVVAAQRMEAQQAALGVPAPPLTPRETADGLRGSPSPRQVAFSSVAGAATPRPKQAFATSITLPTMLLPSSDPGRMLSERALTPRAPPNDQVRPPARPKFLNANRLLSEEMQAHVDSLVFLDGGAHGGGAAPAGAPDGGAEAAAPAASPGSSPRATPRGGSPRAPGGEAPRARLAKEASAHGIHANPERGHPSNQAKVGGGGPKAAVAVKELPKSQKKFAWSSERIAHELVCKFDQFTRRREDHMSKLLWTVGTDPNFESPPEMRTTNCCITPDNFGRICSRFGLICTPTDANEIFDRHHLPTDGTCNLYTLARNFLDTPHDTAQLSRDTLKRIFGTPPPRPVTPRRSVDPYRLAKLPQASWDQHAHSPRLPPLPAAGVASERRETTALW